MEGAAYVSEAKIYPRGVTGPLQRLRHAAVLWLLGSGVGRGVFGERLGEARPRT